MAAIEKLVSPKATLDWVVFQGEGKEDLQGNMKYQASVLLDPKNVPEHQAFLDKIDNFWLENKPKEKRVAKSKGYYYAEPLLDAEGNKQYDEDDKVIYDKEGKVYAVFKTGTTFPDGKNKKVRIYNAKGNVVSLGDKGIGNGSIGCVAGAMAIYTVKAKGKVMDAGVTLYLNDIKLHKFVEYTGSEPGFEEDAELEEDAFMGVEDTFEGEEPEDKPRL